jgi:hypothetical protein
VISQQNPGDVIFEHRWFMLRGHEQARGESWMQQNISNGVLVLGEAQKDCSLFDLLHLLLPLSWAE